MNANDILKEYFGHKAFRGGQEEVVNALMNGRDAVGIMPTGAGKSVCYQVPALMMQGMTVVISPLISLMKDQVSSLLQSGIKAAFINSSLNAEETRQVYRRAYSGDIKILYVTPERLLTEGFLNLSKQGGISMITVDEAHCISQWGQDFRPSYLKIADYIAALPKRPVVSAFTATATVRVKRDIIRLLELNDPIEVTRGFDRKNLSFSVLRPKNKYSSLVGILNKDKERCAVIYCLTRKTTDEVCMKLNADGFTAARYHAGLSDEERRRSQEDFIYDRKNIMVATNAFGMGIDKSNVGLVVHYNMPKDLESYYQEAGRAGRDGSEAECILLYSGSDVRMNRFLIENSNDDINPELTDEMRAEIRKKDIERLNKMNAYCSTADCLRQFILKYFGDTAPDYCGNCSNCLTNFENVDITIDAQKVVSCVYRMKRMGKSFGKDLLAKVLRGSEDKRVIQHGFNDLSTYGIMRGDSKEHTSQVIDFLIQHDYISQSGEYSLIDTTEFSSDIVRNKKQLFMKTAKQTHEKLKTVSALYDIDYNLFASLKMLRSEIAKQERVPAYIVFSDAALRDMCRKMPTNAQEFIEVSGVGRLKADKYGDEFCEHINSYINGDAVLLPKKTQASKKGASWSSEEDEELHREFMSSMTIKEIADKHKRSVGAITARAKKLNLFDEFAQMNEDF